MECWIQRSEFRTQGSVIPEMEGGQTIRPLPDPQPLMYQYAGTETRGYGDAETRGRIDRITASVNICFIRS